MAARLGYSRRSAEPPDLADDSALALHAWCKMQQLMASPDTPGLSEARTDADGSSAGDTTKKETPEG